LRGKTRERKWRRRREKWFVELDATTTTTTIA